MTAPLTPSVCPLALYDCLLQFSSVNPKPQGLTRSVCPLLIAQIAFSYETKLALFIIKSIRKT